MILALEGISAVGKSGVATILSSELGVPIFRDPVRHGLLGNLNRRELFLTGNQCNVTLSRLASAFRDLDVILDRWCLSSYVYDVWGDPGLGPRYDRELLDVYLEAPAKIYLLRVDPRLAFDRMRARAIGPAYSLEDLERLDRAFVAAFSEWRRRGGSIRAVDSTNVVEAAKLIVEDLT